MTLKIFFSWEMETNPQGFDNKTLLIKCINRAIKQLEKEKTFKNVTFEFQEGLSGVSGTPRVAEMMMQRARECDIFIGDMTIVQRLGRFAQCEVRHNKSFMRYSPNSNVLMEYAIAYNKTNDFWQQVILVMNTINGDVKDNAELFPFDIREERHPIKFENSGVADEKTEKNLTNVLVDAIRAAAKSAIKVHKNKYDPLISWEQQNRREQFSGKYEWTDQLEEYKQILLGDNDVIRLIGLSGHGKTRLVLESYRQSDQREFYLYADTQLLGEEVIYSMTLRVFNEFPGAVLVIDNCRAELFKMLQKLKIRSKAKAKLITINHDTSEKEIMNNTYLILKDPQNEVVERIYRRYKDFGSNEERKKFLDDTGGNPMIAEQIVNTLINEGNDIGIIEDNNYISKLLGYDDKSEEREVMRALSLFAEIEYDDTLQENKDIKFVARCKSILSISKHDEVITNLITTIIKNQIRRGNIEKKGTTIRIRPQRLRDGLFEEWVEQCDLGRLSGVIQSIEESPNKEKLHNNINERFYSYFK